MLVQSHFSQIEKNPLLLKMFRDLFLNAGFGFDVSLLINEKEDDGSLKYAWFFALMLNFKHMVSLSSLLELKRQLVIYVESEVMPSLVTGEKTMAVELCKLLAK